jgi:hypothetical protein
MRFILKCATVIALSVVVFAVMQFFDGSHCLDCGARRGFPLAYVQDGTYTTHGQFLWMGLLADLAIAVCLSILTMLLWPSRKTSK